MIAANRVSSFKVVKLSTVSCAFALCLPGLATAETWQFDPAMDLKFGYDDNIRLREIDDAAQETVVGGSLEIARLSEISETRAYLRGSYIAYSSADDSTLDDADIIQVGFQTKRKMSELSGLKLNLEYILDTVGGSSRIDEINPIDNGVDIIEGVVSDQIDRDRVKVAPRWEMELSELGKIALDYSYEDVEFGNNSGSFLRDYDWHRFGAEYAYKRTDTATWKPRLEFVAYESEDGDEVESIQFRLGYEKSLSETSKVWLNIGMHQTELTAIPADVLNLNGNSVEVASVETEENGLLFDLNYRKNTERTEGDCIDCKQCVHVCPTGIDIRNGTQLECINCLECVDACPTVMGKLGKPSLVQWSSTNTIKKDIPTKVFRKQTIMYGIALIIVVALLIIMGGKKEYMLLNVNKTTQLYKVKENHVVTNNFLLLFQNTESEKLTFNLEVIDHPEIKIKRFKPFTLSPGKMAKKVLILETNKILVNDATKDTPITVTLKAYAKENGKAIGYSSYG